MGFPLQHDYNPTNRVGDHICYISDLSKIRAHFPNWNLEYDLPKIVTEIVDRQLHSAERATRCSPHNIAIFWSPLSSRAHRGGEGSAFPF